MVEIFDDDKIYQERFKEIMPEYMRDPIDYYKTHNINPKVIKYNIGTFPIHNGIPIQYSPILFEEGDDLEVKYSVQRVGFVGFNEYM